jgi:site-specific DNA-cytosine methylase
MTDMAAWAALVVKIGFAIVLIEESDKMKPDIIVSLFGIDYIIQWAKLCPTMFAFPIKRERFYGVLMHRMFVLDTYSSLDVVITSFKRKALTDFTIFLEAKEEELRHELAWAIARPGSQALGKSLDEVLSSDGNSFLAALTHREEQVRQDYHSKRNGCVGMLNQSPANSWSIMSDERELATLIHNAAIHWIDIPRFGRWMCASEHLLSQGFPTTARLVNPGYGICDISSCYGTIDRILAEKRQTVIAEAGNSQNTACAYAAILFALVFVKTTEHYD